MSQETPKYELYAIRYAMRNAQRRDHFIGGDPHDAPMPMDYFVWVAVSPERTVVIDTGFNAEVAAKRDAPICAARPRRCAFSMSIPTPSRT
jgi:hypothetical protein